jgi:hypothetical protein
VFEGVQFEVAANREEGLVHDDGLALVGLKYSRIFELPLEIFNNLDSARVVVGHCVCRFIFARQLQVQWVRVFKPEEFVLMSFDTNF